MTEQKMFNNSFDVTVATIQQLFQLFYPEPNA